MDVEDAFNATGTAWRDCVYREGVPRNEDRMIQFGSERGVVEWVWAGGAEARECGVEVASSHFILIDPLLNVLTRLEGKLHTYHTL